MANSCCKSENCSARPWNGDYCNFHALEQYRGPKRLMPAERLARGRRLLRQRAKELGIVLADETSQVEEVVAVAAKRAVRSPMA